MTRTIQSPSTHLGQRFLKLPRELRDLIYFHIVYDDADTPLDFTSFDIQVPLYHSAISAEWLEAAYTHRICRVTFSDPELLRNDLIQGNIWGPYPQHKHLIRRLIVNAPEASIFGSNPTDLENKCSTVQSEVRQEWNELLMLPRLESLRIELQKNASDAFGWVNFSPIVYQLREQIPRLFIELYISFDMILEHKWNIESLLDAENGDRTMHPDPYLPMGMADVSSLIERPTTEDRAYVLEHLARNAEVGSRDIIRGLLDETPANRRLLAQHYVVKEPALLRILMADHYEIYKRMRAIEQNS
jgi:hypothetical protein